MKEGNNERVVLKRVESKINFGRISIKEKEGVKSSLLDEINYLENPTCEIISPDHLAWDLDLEDEFPFIVSPLIGNSSYRTVFGGEGIYIFFYISLGFLPEDSFVFANSFVLSHSKFTPSLRLEEASKWLRGGPRKNLYLLPSE
jgi:6-phosphofructokinase 1